MRVTTPLAEGVLVESRHTCPHCQHVAITCCVCGDTGVLQSMTELIAACKWAWARPGCGCQACARVGDQWWLAAPPAAPAIPQVPMDDLPMRQLNKHLRNRWRNH